MARMIPKTCINLGSQQFHLDHLIHPQRSIIVNHCLIWEATLQPSAISRSYLIRLEYRLGQLPKIHVLKPDIVAEAKTEGRTLPHVFSGAKLCLFHPDYHEWNSNMQLSDTVLPWISEWLFFYEIWLATGEWMGGGEHPLVKGEADKLL